MSVRVNDHHRLSSTVIVTSNIPKVNRNRTKQNKTKQKKPPQILLLTCPSNCKLCNAYCKVIDRN